MFWIILGSINILFALLAERKYRTNSIKVCWMYLMFIILINTFFIGLRDYKVGIDTMVYIDLYFDYARYLSGIDEFLTNNSDYDLGFVLLAYLSSLFCSDSHVFMIFIELFIMIFLICGVMEFKKSINFSLPWFFVLFWLLFNNETFNLMRQFCAMVLLFYGYAQFIQKNYKVYGVAQIVAYFFHSSSILFLMVPCFEYLSGKSGKMKYYYAFAVFAGLILLLFAYYAFLSYIDDMGILKDVYSERYGKGSEYTTDTLEIGVRYVLQRIIPPIVCYILYKRRLITTQFLYMLLVLYISYVLLDAMRFVMIYFSRLGYYIGLIFIVYYSSTFKHLKFIIVPQLLYLLLILIIAIGTYTVKVGGVGAFYSSKILNIE